MNAAADQASKWRSGVLNMIQSMPSAVGVDVDKLRRDIAETGMKAFRDVIDAVAPPIAQHELIQVNLSHDMKGYEGVETLVYRSLAKVGRTRGSCGTFLQHADVSGRSWSKSRVVSWL